MEPKSMNCLIPTKPDDMHAIVVKLVQLKIASECGLMIPTTLCSNDPTEIGLFLGDNVMTDRQLSPGIYQKDVIKKHTIRVTCLGDYLVTVKLNLQYAPIHILPDGLDVKIRMFMRELGVSFGSIDFIVTPDDEYIFISVNRQGRSS